jgi:hypothetical protein
VRKDLNDEVLRRLKLKLAVKHDASLETIDDVINGLFGYVKRVMRDDKDLTDIRIHAWGKFFVKRVCYNEGKNWGYTNYEEAKAKADAKKLAWRIKYKEKMANVGKTKETE